MYFASNLPSLIFTEALQESYFFHFTVDRIEVWGSEMQFSVGIAFLERTKYHVPHILYKVSCHNTEQSTVQSRGEVPSQLLTFIYCVKCEEGWVLMARAYSPSYSGSRHQEDRGSKPAWANSSRDPILKKPNTKKKGWQSGPSGRAP
jgi:hypothetical protein